jgi:hypothetical protein
MLSVVSLLALSACSNDDSDTLTRVPLTIKATIQGAETRVAYNDDGSGSFEKDDVIYVSKLVDGDIEKSDYVNIKYVYDGEKFEPEKTYYFDTDGSSVTFAASICKLVQENLYITINGTDLYSEARSSIPDQTSHLAENNRLFAKTSCSQRSPEAIFAFKYELSKITLNFSSAISSCTISGSSIGVEALVRIESLETVFTGSVKCYVDSESPTKAEAMLFPCSTSAEISVEVVADGKIYKGTIPSTSIVANTHYIYNIKISDVLTVSEYTSITGFEDSGITFEAEQ